jgi:hypothetical protein
MIDHQESAEGKVDLPEDDPKITKLLVQYIYEGEYEPKLPDGGCMPEECKEIVYTGHRNSNYTYKFPHTCIGHCTTRVCPHHMCPNHCAGKCTDLICQSCCPNTTRQVLLPPANGDASQLMLHAQMYEIADKYDVTGLKELAREKFLRACAKYWNDDHFAPAAHHAFTSTSEDDYGLKKVVSSTISQHMALLKKPEVEALLTEFNGLALGLLKARATELGWV